MTCRLRPLWSIMLTILFATALFAQERKDDPRWNIPFTTPMKTTEGTTAARPNPIFFQSKLPRVITTPQEVLLVDPNIQPRGGTGWEQAELDIKAQATNRDIMFGASHNFHSGHINVATFITTNGGTTWYGSDTLADLNTQRGDPAPIIDASGVFIYGHLLSSSDFGGLTGMATNYSTNRGLTWSPSLPITNAGGGDVDKNLVGTDESPSSPYYGNTYMAWCKFTAGNFPAVIMFSRTTDHGVTWSSAVQVNTAASSTFSQGTDIAVGRDGTVYVSWTEESRTSPYISQAIGFAKSTDAGVTWTFTNSAFPTNGIRDNSNFNNWAVRVNDFPRIAMDNTGGGRDGWIYIVQPQKNLAPAGSESDVILHRSTDGGATWSGGIRVNQDAMNNGKVQFFPAVCVDQGGGVNVLYYDNRNYPSVGDSCEEYVSRSLDGGDTWVDIKVSDHSWKPKPAPGVSSFMGDYIGIAAGNGKVWPMWQDDRPGHYTVWTAGVQTTEGFGWVKGTVTNASGGALLAGVSVDFTNPIPQAASLTNGIGFFKVGAKVDTPGTTRNVTLRARKFGFRDTLLTITITRNDTLTRNFAMTPVPNGTLVVRTVRKDSSNVQSGITVLFNGATVASGNTDSLTGIYSTALPLGNYDVLVDPPSPYANKRFNNVAIASGSNPLYVVVRAVIENSPAAMRDTLAVGQIQAKTLVLTNTTASDTVAFRLSDDNALSKMRFRKAAVQPRQHPIMRRERPKGAPDTEKGDSPNGGGGPDTFGYRWVDSDSIGGGVTYNWVEINSVGTPVTTWNGTTDDGSFSTTLPWSFPFYGNSYTNFFFTTNGWIGFNSPSTEYSNSSIPDATDPNNAIYPWWDDLQAVGTSGDGTVYYYSDVANSQYIVEWNNIRHLSATTDTLKFEAILRPNGEVVLQYKHMVSPSNLTTATIGIENADGTDGLQVVYNAAYMHDNLAIRFYLPDATWLSENPIFGRISPGGTQNITVTFDAGTALPGTTYNGKIIMDVTHPDVTGSILIPASLQVNVATNPVIIVSKTLIAFPGTEIGFTRRDSLTVRNGGTPSLIVSSITSTNPRFVPAPTSATIAPGDSIKLRITYSGVAPAHTDTGRVILLSNDPLTPRMDVMLSASSYGVSHVVVRPDTFAFQRNPTPDTTRTNFKIYNTGTDTLRYTINETGTSPAQEARAIQRSKTLRHTTAVGKGGRDLDPGERDSSGGPDAFGYRWIDSDSPGGPAFSWVDISTVGTQITSWTGTSDDGYATVPFPFTFSFYGQPFSGNINVVTNGFLSFTSTLTAYSNLAIPAPAGPLNGIFPFWDDLNLTSGGSVFYYYDTANNRFIVEYLNVPHYTSGGPYTFEVIIKPEGTILYQYQTMDPAVLNSATIGIQNADGSVALQVVYNNTYVHNNLALLITSDIIPWMSTDPTQGTIAPGDSQAVQLRIHPFGTLPGTYYGVQRITGNTPDAGRVRVGLHIVTGVGDNKSTLPTAFALSQNYPNPFNPTTRIKYELPEQATVVLTIYNLLGQQIATLTNGAQSPGYYEALWDGRNNYGVQVSSGVYFYRFEARGSSGHSFVTLKKMLFLK